MKIQNEALVENILAWADSDKSFRHGGFQWSAEIEDELSNDDLTVVSVWGVELSSGVRWQEASIETSRTVGEKNLLITMQSGSWETIQAAFLSPEAT